MEKYFGKNIHDFYYLVTFNVITNLVVGYLLDNYQLMINEFLFTFMYVYCKREPDNIVNFWGFAIKTSNFPWVLLGVSLITGQDIFKILAGYAVGHLYDFLKYTLPDAFGYQLLETPNWFRRLVNWIAEKVSHINYRPQGQANNVRNVRGNDAAEEFRNARQFQAFRGQGMRLGGN